MAKSFMINRPNQSSVIHISFDGVADNDTITLAEINGLDSQLDATGLSISQIWWGSTTDASWDIQRGATSVLTLSQAGHIDFSGDGCALIDPTPESTITCTLNGTTPSGFVLIELQKLI